MAGKKLQITLSDITTDKLEQMADSMGLKRSAVIALAIQKLWEGERASDKKTK